LEAIPQEQQQGKPSDAQQQGSPQVIKPPLAFGLEDGTPVRLRTNRTVSSADAHVKVHDVIVIPRGGIAWGTITEAQPKRRMGREGKLNINIDDVKLLSGEKIPLRAVKEAKGGGHQGAMTGAIVATSIVFFPAAPLFLLMHGKDITIPKGTEITAYVNGDVPLNPTKFAVNAAPATPGADPSLSSIDVKSVPDGAEITVDEKFLGNTPSTIRLAAGDHKIRLEKPGFKAWERTLSVVSVQAANVTAPLELQTNP
jgi:hypothetical protein